MDKTTTGVIVYHVVIMLLLGLMAFVIRNEGHKIDELGKSLSQIDSSISKLQLDVHRIEELVLVKCGEKEGHK